MTAPAVFTAAMARAWLHAPGPRDDKYSRGVVGLRTGSDRYPGAAVLGVQAAWRAGAGMVRYAGPDAARALVLAHRPETVTAAGRVQAWVVGSGTDAAARPPAETAALRALLDGAVPVVVDAGALDLPGSRAPRVLTPHDREHRALRARLGLATPADAADTAADGGPASAARTAAALETARRADAIVVLKGSVTVVAAPGGWATRVGPSTPWLAVAGTGDVLAGALGALVAGAGARAEASGRTLDVQALAQLAATAVWLHADAAARASAHHGGGPVTALDVADALAEALGHALAAS